MKRLSLILVGLISVVNASSFSLSAGYGYLQEKIGGYIKGEKSKNYFGIKNVNPSVDPFTGYLGLKDKTHPYFWIKLKHPIPIIPNFKFQYTKYESTGHSNYIASNVKVFGDVSINTVLTNADTYMAIDSYDGCMFYSFYPSFANIEIGAGADYWRGKFRIYDALNKITVINYEGSIILPYIYTYFESKKLYNFSVEISAKAAKVGDKHHYDVLGALKYNVNIKNFATFFVKLGYKYKEAYYKENENTTKLSYKGAFVEAGTKF